MNLNEAGDSGHYRISPPLLTYLLIAVNATVGIVLFSYSEKAGISYNELLIKAGAKVNYNILQGEYWRFLTPVFLHSDVTHLLVNCYSLYVLGSLTERIFGKARFLAVYFMAGIIGNIASFAFSANPAVGASGAIFGLMGLLLFFGLERPEIFKSRFGYNIIATIALNLFYGFSRSGIDNFAHIGGLLGGFLTAGAVSKNRRPRWYLNRFLLLGAVLIVTISGLIYSFSNSQNRMLLELDELEQLEASEDWAATESKAEKVLSYNPRDNEIRASVLWTLTKAEAIQGKYEEAVTDANKLVALDPIHGHYILGVIYYDMKQFEQSKEQLLEAKKAGAAFEQIDELLEEIDKKRGTGNG